MLISLPRAPFLSLTLSYCRALSLSSFRGFPFACKFGHYGVISNTVMCPTSSTMLNLCKEKKPNTLEVSNCRMSNRAEPKTLGNNFFVFASVVNFHIEVMSPRIWTMC